MHSNRTRLVGQRVLPGCAVVYASNTVVLDGSLFEKEQGGHTFFFRTAWSGDGMTPHAQEPAPLHSNRTGLHGQRGAPGRAVYHAPI